MAIAGKTLDERQLATMSGRFRSDVSPRHLANIASRGLVHRALHVEGDLEIDGDLDMGEAEVQVLIVDGNLTVRGRLEDRDDEEDESLVLVGGDLRVGDLISFGTLEVHGSVVARAHVVLLDNACAAHIEGDLRARFVFDRYHHCKVLGGVVAEVVCLDYKGRIETKHEFDHYDFGDGRLAAVLHRELLNAEDTPDGVIVDGLHIDTMKKWVRAGKDVLLKRS